jgi:hypothetical protein
LIVQRGREHVHFEHDRAERIVAAAAAAARRARANREVALAQRREQIGERLQGKDDPAADAERAAGPDADDEDGQRPLNFGRVVAGPEQNQRNERRGQAGGQREQQDTLVEAEPGRGLSGERAQRGDDRCVGRVGGLPVH